MIPSLRWGLLGRTTSSTVPPHSIKSFCEMPCALSKNFMAKSTQSLTAMETFIFGRFSINSSIVRTPSFGETAITRRSQKRGKPPTLGAAHFCRNGPFPLQAIVGIIDELSHTRSSFPVPTSFAPFTPLHQAALTPIVNG